MSAANGNGAGAGDFQIDVVQLGSGWVLIEPGARKPKLEDLPHLLSQALVDWLVQHPECSVRNSLGIVAGGNTVGVHLWYTPTP